MCADAATARFYAPGTVFALPAPCRAGVNGLVLSQLYHRKGIKERANAASRCRGEAEGPGSFA